MVEKQVELNWDRIIGNDCLKMKVEGIDIIGKRLLKSIIKEIDSFAFGKKQTGYNCNCCAPLPLVAPGWVF